MYGQLAAEILGNQTLIRKLFEDDMIAVDAVFHYKIFEFTEKL